jgi:molecular chaperone HtpG
MTMDFEEPVATVHFVSDMPVNVRALLFVPARREASVLAARKESGVMLYSHNVLIQEYCTDLLPNWLSFVDGVVDSEDISLNVSRETVQSNRIMAQLARTVKGRVLRELKKLAKDDPDKYADFWEEFGRFFKEGVATDFSAKEDVLPLFRYHSSKSDGQLTSLDEYIERMPDSQEEIYYVLGDSVKSVANSPHLDPFKARDLEVLYWVDPIDPFVSPMLTEYKDKKLRNVDDAGLDLPHTEEAAEEEAQSTLPEADFNRVIGRFVTTLGNRVTEVRASKVLKNSPIRLVSPEDETNRDMQRIQRILDQNYEVPKKIVEVNRSHPLIANLAHLVAETPDNKLINLTIEQLYDSALVQEGLHPNPTEMVPRIQQLLELATAS